MSALNQAALAKANNVFAAFGKTAAQHVVSAEHAATADVRAALPKAARALYSALSPVGKVAALFQDDMTARDIFIADGNAFEHSQGRFFLSSVALFLHMGDEGARGVVRDAWADSKDKRREYALKIFRMCVKAIDAGKLDEVRAVTGFASLQALQPKKAVEEKAAVESTPIGNVSIAGTPDAEQAARADMVASATSPAADIAATLARMSDLANAMSAATDVSADTCAAWAGELNELRASLETLAA